jgi:hypothetical protein
VSENRAYSERWFLSSAPVSLAKGGIVHAYPGARFIGVRAYDRDRLLVFYLHAEPRAPGESDKQDLALPLARPNAEEIEYTITAYREEQTIPGPLPELIGMFEHEGDVWAAFVKQY